MNFVEPAISASMRSGYKVCARSACAKALSTRAASRCARVSFFAKGWTCHSVDDRNRLAPLGDAMIRAALAEWDACCHLACPTVGMGGVHRGLLDNSADDVED